MISCIDHIYDETKFIQAKDSMRNELVEFFNNLNSTQFQLIKTFFDEMPKLRHTIGD